MNRATILGRLGGDVEVKSTPSGKTCATFSLATSSRWKDQAGNKHEETEWHNCVAWGKTGEVIAQYVNKGDRLLVEGKLKTRTWEKDGTKHYRTEIVVDQFELLGEKRSAAGSAPQADTFASEDDGGGFDDSDIPF